MANLNILPQNCSVLFLGNSGINPGGVDVAPQVRFFDVYYTSTPAVLGFVVTPEEED